MAGKAPKIPVLAMENFRTLFMYVGIYVLRKTAEPISAKALSQTVRMMGLVIICRYGTYESMFLCASVLFR